MSYNLGTASGKIVIDGSGAAKGFQTASDSAEALFSIVKARMGVFDQLGKRLVAVGVSGQAGLTGAIVKASELEQKLSAIQAVSGATSDQMDKISAAALRIGANTVFTASESASAMEELIKAGISLENVLNGGADAAVALAAAGGIAIPNAAEIAANAMNNFRLRGEDMAHVADLISGAANASAIDVGQFGMSLSQSGAVASIAGLKLDDLAVAIAEMGNAGIKGSDAGTSIKTMLLNLNPVTDRQKQKFSELGILTKDMGNEFFDAQGKIKPMIEIQRILAESTKDMTEEEKLMTLEVMFGSDAIRAAAVMAREGAEGYSKMASEMGKVKAADVAATRLDNLAGSIEQMKGAFESAMISIGQPFLRMIRSIVDAVTFMVNIFNNAPTPIKNIVAGLIAFGSSVSALAGILLLLLPKLIAFVTHLAAIRAIRGVANVITAVYAAIKSGNGIVDSARLGFKAFGDSAGALRSRLSSAGASARTFASAVKVARAAAIGIGAALAVAAAAYVYLYQKQEESKQRVEDYTEALKLDNGELATNTKLTAFNALAKEGLFDIGRKMGLSSETMVNAALGEEAALKRVNDVLDVYKSKADAINQIDTDQFFNPLNQDQNTWQQMIVDIDKVRSTIGGANGEINTAKQNFEYYKEAGLDAADANTEIGDTALDASTKVDELTTAIFELQNQAQKDINADIAFEDAIDGITEQLQSQVDDLAKKYQDELEKAEAKKPRSKRRDDEDIEKQAEKMAAAEMKKKKAFDITTDAGRENMKMLLDLQDATEKEVKKLLELDPSGVKASEALKRARDEFINNTTAITGNRKEAEALANEYLGLPSNVETSFSAPGAGVAKKEITEIKAALEDIPGLTSAKILAPGARPSKQQVDDFMNSLAGIPPEKLVAVETAYKYGGVEAAKIALASIKSPDIAVIVRSNEAKVGAREAQEVINAIHGKTVTVTVQAKIAGRSQKEWDLLGGVSKRAKGGSVKKKKPYWVGERGPELMFPGDDGSILDNESSMELYNGMARIGADIEGLSPQLVKALSTAAGTMRDILNADNSKIPSVDRLSLSGAPTVNRNITNNFNIHNPVAEKTSQSAIKNMSRIGALGVFGDE